MFRFPQLSQNLIAVEWSVCFLHPLIFFVAIDLLEKASLFVLGVSRSCSLLTRPSLAMPPSPCVSCKLLVGSGAPSALIFRQDFIVGGVCASGGGQKNRQPWWSLPPSEFIRVAKWCHSDPALPSLFPARRGECAAVSLRSSYAGKSCLFFGSSQNK